MDSEVDHVKKESIFSNLRIANPEEEKKKRFFSLIALKMTLRFFFFGTFIGFISIFFIAINTTNQLVNGLQEKFETIGGSISVEEIIDSDKPGTLFNESTQKIKDFFQDDSESVDGIINDIIIQFSFIKYIRIAVQDGDDWTELYSYKSLDFADGLPEFDEEIAFKAYEALEPQNQKDIFYGQESFGKLYFPIVSPNHNTMIIETCYQQDSFIEVMQSYLKPLRFYVIMIIVMSLLMGKMFGDRLANPIQKLSFQAQKVAEGSADTHFKVSRRDEIGSLTHSLNIMNYNLQLQLDEADFRVQTMETMNRIDKSVLSPLSRHVLMVQIIDILSDQFTTSRILILMNSGTKLEILDDCDSGHNIVTLEDRHIDQGFKNDILADLCKIQNSNLGMFPSKLATIAKDFEYGLSIPIIMNNDWAGAVHLYRDEEYSDREVDALVKLVDQVGVAFQSVRTSEEREALFMSTILSLSKTIDAKSQWTSGHSGRVARISEKMANKLELSVEEVRNVQLAAILHDIGKIATPESILDKNGKLTNEEYDTIKRHPENGAEILKELPNFDKIMEGVLYHHEKWDGNGYPSGLAGQEIPLSARIITLADVYDAIRSDRPYRKGMSWEEVEAFLNRENGKLFDPGLLPLFIELVRDEEKK